MKPFVLVEIEDGSESNTTAHGGSPELIGIVVDWDKAELEEDYARSMVEEILGRYYPGEEPDATVQAVVDRLQDLVDGIEDEDDYDDEDDEFDDEEDDLDDDLDEEEEEDEEVLDARNNHGQ